MKIRWSRRAKRDLLEIGRFIRLDNPAAARAYLAKLQERARKASRYPLAGRIVPEFRREDLREVIEGNYRIVYRVAKRSVDIITIFEGHRLLSPESFDREEG